MMKALDWTHAKPRLRITEVAVNKPRTRMRAVAAIKDFNEVRTLVFYAGPIVTWSIFLGSDGIPKLRELVLNAQYEKFVHDIPREQAKAKVDEWRARQQRDGFEILGSYQGV